MRHAHFPLTLVAMLVGLVGIATPNNLPAQTTRPAQGTILVLPFTAPSGASDAWIGKAVQQDLLADLSQGTVSHVIAPASAPAAADQDAALGAARQLGASTVVYGQAQVAGKEVRLSGQVLDVASGKSLAAIKSTGPTDQLFHLEDALAGQVFMGLPRDMLSAQTRNGMQELEQHRGQQQPGAQGQWPNGPYANPALNSDSIYGGGATSSQPAEVAPQGYDSGYPYSVYTEPTPVYNYNYYYPADTGVYDYGYGYPSLAWNYCGWGPYWGPGFFVFSNNFHHHGFDHDEFHHHWNGSSHEGNGTWNHGTTGTGSTFAHSHNFGAGIPRGSTAFRAAPRGSTGGFSTAGRISGGTAFHSGGFGGGSAFHGAGSAGGAFHGASGGFHGGSGGFHGGGGGFHGGGGFAGGGHAGGAASGGGGGGHR
jgi:TolB-like protein